MSQPQNERISINGQGNKITIEIDLTGPLETFQLDGPLIRISRMMTVPGNTDLKVAVLLYRPKQRVSSPVETLEVLEAISGG